jgi:ATP-binding cassette subfamily B protein
MWYVEKMRLVTTIFYVIIGVIGIYGLFVYLWLRGQITTGQVIQVFVTMWGFSGALWATGSALPAIFQSIGVIKQAYAVMCDPQDVSDAPDSQPLKVSSGSIVFDNVSFHYNNGIRLFENKYVEIRGGEKIGLVGYTGAGKSTFISLILRFFPFQEGEIRIDGQDITKVTLASLREQIALIPQEPVLFHRTIWENICYGKPNATEAEVLRVAKLAHVDEFIGTVPGGYQAKVGERGTKLSGGEKQRIAIARAMLTMAPILILDEATSALDSLTERYIQESLERLMKGRTSIVIAHRLSTLSRMDRLLVFNEGEIVEEGSHAALLAKGGLYAEMWNMQVGGFLPETFDS